MKEKKTNKNKLKINKTKILQKKQKYCSTDTFSIMPTIILIIVQ